MDQKQRIAFWDQRYDSADYLFGTQPNDFLAATAPGIPAGKLCCLADGEGRNGVYLAELGHEVTSIDASAVALKKAEALALKRKVSLRTIAANLLEYDLGQSQWDCIVSIFFHLPTALRRKLHGNIIRALRPGGYLILEAYTPAQLKFKTGGPAEPDLLMSETILEQDFARLQIIHLLETEREVIEGTGHHGHAAVVQLLARK